MSNSIAQSRNPVIENLQDYIYLQEVRERTSLIGGKIYYDGREWTNEEYRAAFKKPVIRYKKVKNVTGQVAK